MIFDDLILNNRGSIQKKNIRNKDSQRKVYIETYGCQMNLSDSEIILGVLYSVGFSETDDIKNSDLILLNTCSVRENAETKIFNRLKHLSAYKKNNPHLIIGILGCMAERLRDKWIEKEKVVDLVVGPDEYKKLPSLIDNYLQKGEKGIAVKLSKIETYDDIVPVRKKGVSAWITIMRGCDKFCTYCIVPFTRGRERSRKTELILSELKSLRDSGVKDVWLLGQNVNSYHDGTNDFSVLLAKCAEHQPEMRIRFITSHPYDLSDQLLDTISAYKNICKYIHLPVQSGSNRILKMMNRQYSVESYLGIINYARKIIPEISFSTDIITGFPTETEEEHRMTLDIMRVVEFDSAFMFAYSPRENTKSYLFTDDVPEEVKKRRLHEIVELQNKHSYKNYSNQVGNIKEILIESFSKKSGDYYVGRTDCNKSTIVPVIPLNERNKGIGDFVNARIIKANSATLFGDCVFD
jgi:tRNA-2-methylthio-N6-dimethylallyladenosine synthase